jgi:hypothetical protein
MKAWGDVLACATCVGVPWVKADLGFFWSTLFLMVVPVAVAGLIGGWLYMAYRRRRDGVATGARRSPPLTSTQEESGP